MHLKKCCTVKVIFIITVALLALLIGMVLFKFLGLPKIVESQLDKNVELAEGTVQWDRFKKLPIDLEIRVYIFHVNNAAEVMEGAKPNLTEIGPYYYSQSVERVISGLNSEDDSVTYTQIRNLTFNEVKSAPLKKTDRLTVINPILIGITQTPISGFEWFILKGCLGSILPSNFNSTFIEVEVEDFILNGLVFARDTDVTTMACYPVRDLFIRRSRVIRNVDVVSYENDTVKELKFSLLNFRQSKEEGIYTMNRGIKDITQLGNIMKWNHRDQFPYWGTDLSLNNDKCNTVRGSDATIYPPGATKTQGYEIFASDICRVVAINYDGTGTYKGIDGYYYSIDENTLRTKYSDPEQDCYCTKKTSNQTGSPSCFLDGIMDVMPCFKAPILLSWPHFLYAEHYLDGVDGLSKPDPKIHKTTVLLEPNTGTPLEGEKRVQLNFVLRPNDIDGSKLLPTILPFVWLSEGVKLTQELVDELDSKYYGQIRTANGVIYGLIAVSAAAFCISLVFLLKKKCCTDDR